MDDIKYERAKILITFGILFLTASGGFAAEKKSSPIELIHSDHLEIKNYDNNIILNLEGNVQFKQDSTFLSSGRAVWYKSAGQIVLIDDVFLDDGKGGTVRSDRATYYRSSKKITALGNMKATADSGRVVITGRRGSYLRESKYVVVTGNPELVSRNKEDTSSVTITAEKLEYFGIDELGVATDSVKITKGDMLATGGLAEYYRSEEYVVLYNDPVVIEEDSHLKGDTIWVTQPGYRFPV